MTMKTTINGVKYPRRQWAIRRYIDDGVVRWVGFWGMIRFLLFGERAYVSQSVTIEDEEFVLLAELDCYVQPFSPEWVGPTGRQGPGEGSGET